ncbi:unnamed protein product [Symbiodinium microadriaticum]|nr:unnamed protein product [Symbiodinium microadriaticum]
MPQQPEAAHLCQLTEVPVGWPLATVIDAFSHLAACGSSKSERAREVLSHRLEDLWAAQPAEAEAWLQRCRERFATELAGEATRPEELYEALLRHGAAEDGKYWCHYYFYDEWGEYNGAWRFSEAGLLQGEPCGSAAERERVAARYLQRSDVRDRCRELAERLAAAESQETARKRQKLEEQETTERRRLEAELHKSQEEECRDLRNRLAAAEAEVSSKTAELQTAQSEAAKCKERCDELATRAAAAESALAEMWQELAQLQEEHGTCQQRCGELADRLGAAKAEASEHAKTKELLAQAKSDAAEKQSEVQRLQEESRECVSAEEAKSNVELRLEKAVLLERCEQLRQQLAKAEGKLGQMQVLWEEKATYKERCRQLERQLSKAKPPRSGRPSVHAKLSRQVQALSDDTASSGQESDLTEYILVDDEAASSSSSSSSSSVLSHSSWFSVKPNCFMPDAIFKTRDFGVDFFLMGRDLRKGSRVVAGDDETILEVCDAPFLCQAKEVVRLQAGAATLRVTADHSVQVPAADGAMEGGTDGGSCRYVPAGSLKPGSLVMLDSGQPAALTGVASETGDHEVLKVAFKPNQSVAVFSCPPCILSKGANSKPAIRRARMGQRRGQRSTAAGDADEGRASMPNTAGASTEILLRGAA